mgnify:CR=1 FL=1
MKRAMLLSVLLAGGVCCRLAADEAETGRLTVVVKNVAHQRGRLRLALVRNAREFADTGKAKHSAIKKIEGKEVTFVFDGVAFGEIALKAHHDENGNGTVETNVFGIPKEPYGLYRAVYPTFRAPRFDDAKFRFDKPSLRLVLKLK